MKKNLLTASAVLLLCACDNTPKFNINGTISNAEDKTVYLEAATLGGVQLLDSARLDSKGTFHFAANQPEYTEFYRLRLDDQIVNLAIDSTETIQLTASCPDAGFNYTLENSEQNMRIKKLTLRHAALQAEINRLIQSSRNSYMSPSIFQERVNQLLNTYKSEIKREYIFKNPSDPAAYLALFQQVNGQMIFNPLQSKEDQQCFAAVATSMKVKQPESVRTQNLCNIAIKGLQNMRPVQQQQMKIPKELIHESGLIDISLADLNGKMHNLTDLKGKAVILSFCAYKTNESAAHNLILREIYNEYKDQGLEIYQVSLDNDEHFWKISTDNLPWICVRDPQSIQSTYAAVYGITSLPTYFLINRNNEVKQRISDVKELKTAVKSLL